MFSIILLILYTRYSTMSEIGLLNTLLLFQIQDDWRQCLLFNKYVCAINWNAIKWLQDFMGWYESTLAGCLSMLFDGVHVHLTGNMHTYIHIYIHAYMYAYVYINTIIENINIKHSIYNVIHTLQIWSSMAGLLMFSSRRKG